MAQNAEVLKVRREGRIAFVTFNRPDKRNAVNDALVDALRAFVDNPGADTRVIVVSGEGGNFSSGLDLSEHVARAPHEVMRHSRGWHEITSRLRYGGLPVVAALSGAVMGGGLEIAACCHVRVAEDGTTFRMPEGQRGIFVGGGGSVRIAEIIGHDRLGEMMLTGRSYSATEGIAIGLAHYVEPPGGALAKATELAGRIAENSATVNYLITQAMPRIARMSEGDGLFTESLAAALSQTGTDAEEGLKAFLEKRKPRFS